MASFTDSISQFNPYVQQLPVEEMTKVGMYKQSQYDQGVQKIQTQIDNVAGLDVMHEADKKYLQSKLGQLSGRLKSVAAGDFSNQQLVSSVGGMASSLIKDQNIQNAVASTARYKKESQELEKAYKEGKSSIANVDDFRTKADAWLSNDKAGQVFNSRYTPYVDYKKQWLEVIKSLHADETGKDFAYERYIDPVTGQVKFGELAIAMEREGVEGISEGKIKNAINAIMSPDALNQMRIDANYQFKGVTPEDLAVRSVKQFENREKEITTEIERLQAIAGLDDAKPALKKRALDAIKTKQEELAALPGQLSEQLKYVAENPEEAKINIFKQGALDQFAGAFSWEKRTTQIVASPIQQGQNDANSLAIRRAELALARDKFSFQKFIDLENLKLGKDKFAKEYPTLAPFTTVLGAGTKGLPMATTVLNREIVAAGNQAETDINMLLDSVPELKASKLPLAQKRAMLQQRLIAFQNGDENQFGANLRDVATRILNSRRVVQENEVILKNATAEVEKDPAIAARKLEFERDLSRMPGTTINANGKTIKLSSKELFNISKVAQEILSNPGGTSTTRLAENLSDKEKEVIALAYPTGTGKAYNETLGNQIRKQLYAFNPLIAKNRQYVDDVNGRVEGYISSRVSKFTPQIEDLDASTGVQRQRYEGALRDVLARYVPGGIVVGGETQGGDELASPDDIAKAKGWLAGPNKNDIQYKTVTQGGDRYMYATLGSEQIILKMTNFESSQIKSEIDKFGQSVLDKQIMFNGSTNFTPNGDVSGAMFQRNDFVKSKRFPIVADLKYNPVNTEENFINLQIKHNGSWHPYQLDRKMSATAARNLISGWTDEDTKTFLAGKGINIK
jgi:hypothetical protein